MAFRQTGNFPESKVTKLREIFDAFGSPGDAFTWRLRWRDGERCQCQSCQQVSTNAYNMPTICLQFSKVFSKVLLRRSMKPPSHLRSSTKQGQEQVISAQEADTSTSFCASAFFCEEVEMVEMVEIHLFANHLAKRTVKHHPFLHIFRRLCIILTYFEVWLWQSFTKLWSLIIASGDQYLSRNICPWSRRAVPWNQ